MGVEGDFPAFVSLPGMSFKVSSLWGSMNGPSDLKKGDFRQVQITLALIIDYD